MKITIDSRDLPYTIDTYAMFNGDGAHESEADYLRETYNLTDEQWQNIGFDYDHKAIVEALATESVNLLEQNLVQHNETDGAVLSITLPKEVRSPQFYNYTTDSYTAEWDIDFAKLRKAVTDHQNKDGETFQQYQLNSSWGLLNDDGTEDETLAVAMLDFWLPSVYDTEDYNMAMWEHESEAYYENMQPDAETQQLIDSKEAQNV